jgi:hypothetical protein
MLMVIRCRGPEIKPLITPRRSIQLYYRMERPHQSLHEQVALSQSQKVVGCSSVIWVDRPPYPLCYASQSSLPATQGQR